MAALARRDKMKDFCAFAWWWQGIFGSRRRRRRAARGGLAGLRRSGAGAPPRASRRGDTPSQESATYFATLTVIFPICPLATIEGSYMASAWGGGTVNVPGVTARTRL